jgi:hypothetical protein
MKDPEFIAGRIDTKFMERFLAKASADQRSPAQPPAAPEARVEMATAPVTAPSEQVEVTSKKRRARKSVKERG